MLYECHYNTLRIASRLYFVSISAKDLWAYTAKSSDAGICVMALLTAAITKTTNPSRERPPASENKRKETNVCERKEQNAV